MNPRAGDSMTLRPALDEPGAGDSVSRFGGVLVRRGARGARGAMVDVEVEVLVLPPHPATAKVAARTASSVSMAASDVRLIGRPPVVAH